MTTSLVPRAGWLCLTGAIIGAAGGLYLAMISPAVSTGQWSYPLTPTGFLAIQTVFVLNHVMLLAGIAGVLRSGAAGSSKTGRAGTWIAISGMVLLTLCEIRAMTLANSAYPTPQTDTLDMAYGISTILIGIGLTALGVAVARAGVWTGWQMFIVLITGVAVFIIVIPGVFGSFLAARLALITWMLMFAAMGAALLRLPQASSS